MTTQFQALMVNQTDDHFTSQLEHLSLTDLPQEDVTIRVHYSSVNYKDGLAAHPEGKVAQSYPLIPGVDLAGTVVSSEDKRYQIDDRVIVTRYGLGVSHHGGYSEYASVPGDWIVPAPDNLTLKEAMTLGTAGFTAALSIYQLENNGLTPESGDVLVTGATGGVGSMAIAILAKKHYQVTASTGKASEHVYLRQLGAQNILSREDVAPEKIRSLGTQQWAGAVDAVGGRTLASILSNTVYGGSVAVSGLTGGANVPTTVFPFILRSVNLLGIDSVYCSNKLRKHLWHRLATDLKPESLEAMSREISLQELPSALSSILEGQSRGRTVVNVAR